MKIAVDIDDVIADLIVSLNQYYNITYGANIRKEECLEFDLSTVWKISKEKTLTIITDYYQTSYFEKVQPLENAIESLKYLSKEHTLYAVTGRPTNIENLTLNWINKHFPNLFKEVHHTNLLFHTSQSYKKKSDICKTIKVDLIIEDNFEYAVDCVSCGITTFLFEAPWNKNKKIIPNMIRVKNWKEVISTFKEKYE